MSMVHVQDAAKAYGSVRAVDGVSFELAEGKLLTLLGPSGCGKTTMLRCIAGLETLDEGTIVLGGEVVSAPAQGIEYPAERRQLGMVFQSYALWPHMTAFENVAYGLRLRGISKREIPRQVRQTMDWLGMAGLEDRYPGQMSGGQQQRVALARCLVYRPRILLLDEPLSNLDAHLRQSMRYEIRALQQELGLTVVYVSHDQSEAFVLSDVIALMRHGKIEQIGSGEDLYYRPRSEFAAGFIGSSNIIPAVIVGQGPDNGQVRVRLGGHGVTPIDLTATAPEFDWLENQLVSVALKPECARVEPANTQNALPNGYSIPARLNRRWFLGDRLELEVEVAGHKVRSHNVQGTPGVDGEWVSLMVRGDDLVVLPRDVNDAHGPDGDGPLVAQ